MIKLNMPVIVEGKYDKITLENVVDTLIIVTNGFSLFHDKEKCALIKMFAKRDGVIVLTDSDSAGNMIRNHIKNIVGDGKIYNVYVPRIEGKEKRKASASKEGILGVEGLSKQVLIEAFERSGVTVEAPRNTGRKITKTDMYLCGLSGAENSAALRKKVLRFLNLPDNLSANALLAVLNTILSFEEFERVVTECLRLSDKD